MNCSPCKEHPFVAHIPLEVDNVINDACKYLCVRKESIMGKRRDKHLVDARSIIYHLIRFNPHFNYGLKTIGKIFDKDHTSILHSLQNVPRFVQVDEDYKHKIEGCHKFVYGSLKYFVL